MRWSIGPCPRCRLLARPCRADVAGPEGRRLLKKFLKQVNRLQRSNGLTRKVFGMRLRGAFACFGSRSGAQRLIKMRIKRLANYTRIVTRFTVQQSFRNEHVDFRFA